METTACCVFLPTAHPGVSRVATSSHDGSLRIWDQNTAGKWTYTHGHSCNSSLPLTRSLWCLCGCSCSLFGDSDSGRCGPPGVPGPQRPQQSPVRQLQRRTPRHSGGRGSGFWFWFHRLGIGHKSSGALLVQTFRRVGRWSSGDDSGEESLSVTAVLLCSSVG